MNKPARLAAYNVLLLEDDLMVGEVIQKQLNALGVPHVQHVHSIEDALHELETFDYALAVLDVRVGCETSEAVAQLATGRGCKVLVMSGAFPPPQLAEYEYLQKPVSRDKLRKVVGAVNAGLSK